MIALRYPWFGVERARRAALGFVVSGLLAVRPFTKGVLQNDLG